MRSCFSGKVFAIIVCRMCDKILDSEHLFYGSRVWLSPFLIVWLNDIFAVLHPMSLNMFQNRRMRWGGMTHNLINAFFLPSTFWYIICRNLNMSFSVAWDCSAQVLEFFLSCASDAWSLLLLCASEIKELVVWNYIQQTCSTCGIVSNLSVN